MSAVVAAPQLVQAVLPVGWRSLLLANYSCQPPPTSQQTLSSYPLTGRKASVYFWCQRSIRAKELHSVAKLFFSWSVREGRLVGLWAWSAGRPWPAAVMQWCCHPVALQRLERTPTSTGEGHANPTSQLLHLSKRLWSESLVNVRTLPPLVVNSWWEQLVPCWPRLADQVWSAVAPQWCRQCCFPPPQTQVCLGQWLAMAQLASSQFNRDYFCEAEMNFEVAFQLWGREQWRLTSSRQHLLFPLLASRSKDSLQEQSLSSSLPPATSSSSPSISFSLPPRRGRTVITFMTVTLGGTGGGPKFSLLFQTHTENVLPF